MFFFNVSGQEQKKQFILSSGSVGGNYNKTGLFITKTLDSIYPEFKFRNIVSSGSLENIKRIDERFSDFAIIQRDVLLENIYHDVNSIKNIEVILPLFQEKLLIYKKRSLGTERSFFNNSKNLKTIGFTSKTAYSFKIFEIICKLLNINLDEINIVEENYLTLSESLSKGDIDAVVTFSLPIESIESNDEIEVIGFSDAEIALITAKTSNISAIAIEENSVNKTIGSWAFLVGLDTSVSEIDAVRTNGMSDLLYNNIEVSGNSYAKVISNSIGYFQNQQNHSFIYGIPLNDSTEKVLNYSSWNANVVLFIFSFFIIVGFIFYMMRKQFIKIDYFIIWIRYKHIILGVLLIFVCYLISVEGLLMAEHSFYDKLGLKSKVLNLTKADLHFWIIITNLTGNNNNIFPLSYSGQLMLSFSSYILIVGSIIIGLCEYIIYKINKKRDQGIMKLKIENHIVVIGWKSTTPKFLEELVTAKISYKKRFNKIICIVENPSSVIKDNLGIKKLKDKRIIEFVAGDASEEKALDYANIQNAHTVVVLSENTTKEADEKTLLRCLAISRYCRRKTIEISNKESDKKQAYQQYEVKKYIDSIYIIAELNDQKYTEDLKKSDVNEVINSSVYSKNIITQSLLNHGVSKVLDEVLSHNDFNEFYTIDLKLSQFKNLVNKSYDELIPVLRKKGVLLIGIKVVYHSTEGLEIIDEDEINRLLKQEELERQIIVNPIIKIELNRKTDNDDQLIVFCNDTKEIEKVFL